MWIKSSVIEYIHNDGKKWCPLETGGILIGYRSPNLEFVITDLIGSGPNAKHGRTSFEPDYKFQKEEIARVYTESHSTESYLGDWHTHPNSYPYLSPTDIGTFNRIANFRRARIPSPLMLIAAPPRSEFFVWIYQQNQNHIRAKVLFY